MVGNASTAALHCILLCPFPSYFVVPVETQKEGEGGGSLEGSLTKVRIKFKKKKQDIKDGRKNKTKSILKKTSRKLYPQTLVFAPPWLIYR